MPGFARSFKAIILAGLSTGTMSTRRFLANVRGLPAMRLAVIAAFIWVALALAKISAVAPCEQFATRKGDSSKIYPKVTPLFVRLKARFLYLYGFVSEHAAKI